MKAQPIVPKLLCELANHQACKEKPGGDLGFPGPGVRGSEVNQRTWRLRFLGARWGCTKPGSR